MKAWSISTTIRNPDRIPDFVKVLSRIAGREWNSETQEDFYIWAIAMRVVTPEFTNLSDSSMRLLESAIEEIPFDKAKTIFDEKRYTDPPMRGRNQMAPLNSLGLATTTGNEVQITPLGRSLLENVVSLSEIMSNFAFKFQVPQPGHSKYKSEKGYNIKPFAGALGLITTVNTKWKELGHNPVGLNWEEFCIFVPTLIDFTAIDHFADTIIAMRTSLEGVRNDGQRKSIWESSFKDFLRDKLDTNEVLSVPTLNQTLHDYGDNIFRYFKQSQFLKLRGGGHFVDISEISAPQVQLLIDHDEFRPASFATKKSMRIT